MLASHDALRRNMAAKKLGTSKEAAQARKRHFVEAYLQNGGNATGAAAAAGYSPRTARQQGTRLLSDVAIQQALKRRREQLQAKLELTTENVLRSLAQAVHFDVRKLFKEDGTVLLPHQLDPDTAAALVGLEIDVDAKGKITSAKYKAAEKNAAREQAMRHLGLFNNDNAQRSLLDGVPREVLKLVSERLRRAGALGGSGTSRPIDRDAQRRRPSETEAAAAPGLQQRQTSLPIGELGVGIRDGRAGGSQSPTSSQAAPSPVLGQSPRLPNRE